MRRLVAPLVLACLLSGPLMAPPSAIAAPARARLAESSCVMKGTRLSELRLERLAVSNRPSVRKRWKAQWVRVRPALEARQGGTWKTVRWGKRRDVRVATRTVLWEGSGGVRFRGLTKAPAYRARIEVQWFNPANGRVERRQVLRTRSCARVVRVALTCPANLRFASGSVLAWDPVAGASGYYVRQRRLDGQAVQPVTARSAAWESGRQIATDPNVELWVEPYNASGTINCPRAVRGRSDRLTMAQPHLHPGAQLTSPGGRHALVMQGDGNLVLYEAGVARWWIGQGVRSYAAIQTDGNFVVYPVGGGAARWHSHTNGIGAGAQVVLTDTGQVAVLDRVGAVRWQAP
jgi:hypothetical protein